MHIKAQSKRYRMGELGAEARCSRCREWWPADSEFFYKQSDGQPHSFCKACYSEWRGRSKPPRTTSPAATGNTDRERLT